MLPSADELQHLMDHPLEGPIREYALEIFDEPIRRASWLGRKIPALQYETPESLLISGTPDNLRSVLRVLIQIDYGVIG